MHDGCLTSLGILYPDEMLHPTVSFMMKPSDIGEAEIGTPTPGPFLPSVDLARSPEARETSTIYPPKVFYRQSNQRISDSEGYLIWVAG